MKRRLLLTLTLLLTITVAFPQKNPLDYVKKEYDEFKGLTFYKMKGLYVPPICPYIVHPQGAIPFLRVNFTYRGSEWVFFDKILLTCDGGGIYQVSFSEYEYDSQILSSGSVKEWIDIIADDELINYLKNFVKSEKPKIRFTGKYEHTTTFNKQMLKPIVNVLNAYDVLLRDSNNAGETPVVQREINYIPDVRNAQWGMTASEVRQSESAPPIAGMSSNENLIYSINIYGFKCFLTYGFKNGKLDIVLALFNSIGPDIINGIISSVSETYGEPVSQKASSVVWLSETTKILLAVTESEKDGKMSLSLSYFPIKKNND